jgi:hypothetical protein
MERQARHRTFLPRRYTVCERVRLQLELADSEPAGQCVLTSEPKGRSLLLGANYSALAPVA